MTEHPGWETPSGQPGERPEPPRPPVTADWATEQPPAAPPPPGWGQQPGWGPQPGWGGPPPWMPPKPGVIPLRPLGVGEILDGAISTIRAKPRLMLGLSALVAVLTQLVTVPVTWLLLHDAGGRAFNLDPNGNLNGNSSVQSDLSVSISSFTASGIQACVTLVATLLLTGVLTVVLSRAVLGQDIDGREAWAQTRPRLPALIGLTILVFLVELGVVVLCVAPGTVLAVAGAPAGAIALAFLVGVPAMLVALPYLYVSWALAPASVVLEKQSVFAALNRSRRLVKGAWWRTFGILVLVNIIAGIVSGVLGGIFSFAGLAVAGVSSGFNQLNPYTLVPLIIVGVGSVVASTITWPFTAVATALIYVDRRIRREGLDLELVRAAGRMPTGQSTTPGTPLDGVPPPYQGAPPPYGG